MPGVLARDYQTAGATFVFHMLGGKIGAREREDVLDDRQARAAVGVDMAVLGFRELGVERYGDRAGMHRAQPGGGELGRVAHQQQHAVAGRDAKRAQRVRCAGDLRREFDVAERLRAADQRGARPMPLERRATEKVFYSIQTVSCAGGFIAERRSFA